MQTMQKKQDQLSTGKRVSAPSDDPVAISKILKYKTKINELEQYDKNSKDALSWTQTSELAITDISDALGRARELAVQAANETNTAGERENIAKEIRQLKDHIIGNANKTFAGKYIFSSFQTDKKLLNPDGSFNINITEKELTEKPTTTYEVGVGETMEVSTNGLDLFGAIADDSNYATKLVSGAAKGVRATQTRFIGKGFDPSEDYSGGNYDFEVKVNGVDFDVDLSSLNGTSTEITNEEFKNVIQDIEAGGTKLGAVATISFDSNNNLIIESKDYGEPDPGVSGEIIVDQSPTPVFSGVDTIPGEDIDEATIPGSGEIFIDENIEDDKGIKKMVVEYFGETKEISIDMSDYDEVGEFVTALEGRINTAFTNKIDSLKRKAGLDPNDPSDIAYGIEVTNTGGDIGFRTVGSVGSHDETPNGETIAGPVPSLDVRPVKSEEPEMMADIENFIKALKNNETDKIDEFIGNVDQHLENVNASRSEIGAKTNRLEMILSRIGDDSINVTQLLSNSQDVDMAETIMLLKNAENVYKASLSAGARVIQPSLLDFLR